MDHIHDLNDCVLDISHGQRHHPVSVKVSQGQGTGLPGQIGNIGIQLVCVAPVIVPWLIRKNIAEQGGDTFSVLDRQYF